MKENIQKELLRRTSCLSKQKLYSWNFIKGINTWAVPLVTYSGPFLKGAREELKRFHERTRKLMTTDKALHPRDDVDRLYVKKRKKETTYKAWRKTYYSHKNNTDNTKTSKSEINRKLKWEEKQHYRRLND